MRRVPRDLACLSVVVTGASSGIGRATVLALASRGARVAAAARSQGSLERLRLEAEGLPGSVLPVPTDVACPDAVTALASTAASVHGGLDAWVNAAATMAYGTLEDTPLEVHRQVIDTNLFGVIHGVRAAVPHLRRRGGGTVVNVGSQYAQMTSPYVSAYVASKYALLGLDGVLRQELATDAIRVCSVLPGSVDTPIFRQAANFTGRRTRPIPPVADPERVVDAILRCLVRPRRQVAVGQTARLLAIGHALLPGVHERLAPRAMGSVGLAAAPAPPGPGNVFEPNPAGNRATGGWRSPALRVAVVAGAVSAVPGMARPLRGALRRVTSTRR
jgi:NAD(P)-dependent dehydrogenase (short-subunit alcohol dehydrogenase family)